MNPESMLPYEEEAKIRRLLRAAAAGDGLSTPDRVERVLVERMRQARRRAAGVRVFAAGAIAATVLFGLGLLRDREEAAPVAAVVTPPKAPVIETVEAAPAVEPAKPVKRRRANRERAPRMEPTEFIPVGAWQAIEPMERGSIVRVRLSKSTLPVLGIPVSPDVWNETVPADVVLGEDGTMRAVRFVRTAQ